MPACFSARRAARLFALAAMSVLAALPCAAQPDAYPSKPITIVVGYPPGGSTDLNGRTLGAELSRRLGVPVIIDNVGGAGGAIGAQKVANAAPDGYTLHRLVSECGHDEVSEPGNRQVQAHC